MEEALTKAWMRAARRVAWVANFHWVLVAFLPAFVVLNGLAALGWLLARQERWAGMGWVYLVATFLVLIGAWVWARRRFLSTSDALERLEEHFGLHSRLSAAREGAVAWPALPMEMAFPFRWQLARLLRPLVASAALLLAGLWIPVGGLALEHDFTQAGQPVTWEELQAVVDALEKDELLEEEPIKVLQEKLASLREQPVEQWFTQSSLEAGESLREQTLQDLRQTAQSLQDAAVAMEAMRRLGTAPDELRIAELEQRMAGALENLQMGTVPADAELCRQVQAMCTAGACQAISPDQFRLVVAQLEDGAQRLAMVGGQDLQGFTNDADVNALIGAGSKGCVSRGPGAAPLFLSDGQSTVAPAMQAGVSNQDLSNAALGDIVGLQDRAPDKDDRPVFTTTQAAAGVEGQGGDVIWKNQLTPEERDLLERYFE